MKSLYIEIRKSKNGKPYPVLIADIGYANRVITYDRAVIMEISPVAPCVLLNEPIGSRIEVI